MDEQLYESELVRRAQRGDKESLNHLAKLARDRLRVYVYRLTLRDDMTQEIVQESLFEMCKILGKLEKADRFWPWLYGIATNKFRRHQRTERTQKKAAISKAGGKEAVKNRQEGLEKLVSEELQQIVSGAIQKLKTRQKAVLVMRCYDGLSYSEIAESMGCSEFSTRMLFLRAKRALQKELGRNGFSKGSLLAALIVFGKITAPSKAAAAQVSVTAATTNVGVLAGLVGVATTKTAIVSLTAATALSVGTMVLTSEPPTQAIKGGLQSKASAPIGSPLDMGKNGSEEYWYYFPEGPDGPMMMRVRAGATGERSRWHLLQNNQANYYYRDNTIHINNYRMWSNDLRVFEVPTDGPRLREFISKVQGGPAQMEYVAGRGRGLLVIAKRKEQEALNRSWVIRHYNVLDEDYFQGDWPTGAKTIDNRDIMHKRGWTYFTVSGHVNGEEVRGVGRMPFVYATSGRYSPWLKLQIGSRLKIIDLGDEACLYGRGGTVVEKYEGGNFFKGLGRPWMGLHAVDTVRRDAAEQEVLFETKGVSGSGEVEVKIVHQDVGLVYAIDLESDVIGEIVLLKGDSVKGRLEFSYLQEVDDAGEEFIEPARGGRTGREYNTGLLWLVQLAEGTLGR